MHLTTSYTKHNQTFTIKSTSNNQVIISGYASVYNIADHQNDVIISGAFNNVNYNDVKFLWQHDSSKPIGIVNNLCENEYGLQVTAAINTNVRFGKEAIELIKQGAVNGLSIGFYINSSYYRNNDQRIITDADLVEISIVTFPANTSATIQHILNTESPIDTESIKNNQLEKLISALNSLDHSINKHCYNN